MQLLYSFSSFRRQFRLLILACFAIFCCSPADAQYYILGRGLDDQEKPYAYAVAELRGEGIFREQTTSDLGVFRFEDLPSGTYELTLITAYGVRRKKVELRGSIDVTLHISRNIQISEISVVAKRAGSTEPVTHTDLREEDIRSKNTGQDMPYILEGSPSVVVSSDAGHGIGYTGVRIRGTDPTRILVTLNGIPVNDAESHQMYWVDMPGIASVTKNIQIVRGIGWSQPGAGELGAGIHLNTLAFHPEPFISLDAGLGSFKTRKAGLQLSSGLLKGRFTIDAKGSYLESGGYIDRADSQLYSIYAGLGYHHDLSNVRFVFSHGDELTYQAWNGVPEQYLDSSTLRTFNSAGTEKSITQPHDNEVDDYAQTHYQLHFDQSITPYARWTNIVHYTRGKGFFEQYKAEQDLLDYALPEGTSDLIRRLWLDNHFYGFTSTVQIGSTLKRYFVIGGGWNQYKGDHFGEVIWTERDQHFFTAHQYYFNQADKKDWNIFGRSNIKITDQFDATVDLQARWIRYSFEGPNGSGGAGLQEISHRFFNPKLGFRFLLSEESSLYALSGIIHKEPNRDDYINSTPTSRPLSERLWDSELGFRFQSLKHVFEINAFYMDYRDQLLPTGRLNEVGAYARVNVPQSHRLGLETYLAIQPHPGWDINGSLTISRNKIKSFEEYIDDWDTGIQVIRKHENSDIAFSPGIVANLTTSYDVISSDAHEITIHVTGKQVGKQYVDNTSDKASGLDPYTIVDTGISWNWKALWAKDFRLHLFMKNVLDHQYESNGWIYRFQSAGYNPVPDDPYAGAEEGNTYHLKGYFPQAGRHLYVSLSVAF